MNWQKENNEFIDIWSTLGTNLNNTTFQIIGGVGNYTLSTKIGIDFINEIGRFTTLDMAKHVAKLIDDGK